ncbi:TrkA family potassium uptake protein [Anaerovorax odorimutans]|uniref:TrkA family potassium uptake protein n=1 Tax=Anaerovorax odorimutans TaxID=109327 RepID=A0ABT1RT25_9FIRM|nr:TrkA family potassium uptake protein [Anaerovorax odorimutans]MCQ4638333.1 TrkA family potassium uptake protein [Anaerovorax odorimutans]
MKEGRRSGFGIIGLGRFGLALAKTLAESGAEVIAIDGDENKLRLVRNHVQDAFRMGKLTKDALEETGIGECETVVVCIGEKVDVSLLTTLNVLNLGVPRVIAKADSIEHGIILERIGAEVVHPEMETATRLAAVLLGSKALDMMRLNDDYVVSEIKVDKRLHGKTIHDLHLDKYDLKLIALEKEPNITLPDASLDEVLTEDDAILVIGKFADADRFERKVMNRG